MVRIVSDREAAGRTQKWIARFSLVLVSMRVILVLYILPLKDSTCTLAFLHNNSVRKIVPVGPVYLVSHRKIVFFCATLGLCTLLPEPRL